MIWNDLLRSVIQTQAAFERSVEVPETAQTARLQTDFLKFAWGALLQFAAEGPTSRTLQNLV